MPSDGSRDETAPADGNETSPAGPAPEETQDRLGVVAPREPVFDAPEPRVRTAPEKRALMVAGGVAGLAAGFQLAAPLLDIGLVTGALLTGAMAGALALALSMRLFAKPARESLDTARAFTNTLSKVTEPRRKISFDALLCYRDDPELGRVARLIHDALTSTHQHRLEAGWLRREMDNLADSKARAQTEALRKEANTDPLTNLVNRRGFEQAFGDLFVRAKRDRIEMALLAIDLDKFKELNDTHGHAAGDEALIAAGEVLRAQTRESDVAARIGGDELFLVLFDTDRKEAKSVAHRLAESFACHRKARTLGGDWPTMSIGVALAHEDGAHDERELFHLADEALYASKRAGRSRATMYREIASGPRTRAA